METLLYMHKSVFLPNQIADTLIYDRTERELK